MRNGSLPRYYGLLFYVLYRTLGIDIKCTCSSHGIFGDLETLDVAKIVHVAHSMPLHRGMCHMA
jgi:hypothetical protein